MLNLGDQSKNSRYELPEEVTQLHRISGLNRPWGDHRLNQVCLEFEKDLTRAIATNGHSMAVIEWGLVVPEFKDNIWLIDAYGLKAAASMRFSKKRPLEFTTDKRLVVGDYSLQLPEHPDGDWLNWRKAVVLNEDSPGHVEEIALNLQLLSRIETYVKACGREAHMAFKFTGPLDVVRGRIGRINYSSPNKKRRRILDPCIDLFIMPLRGNNEWDEEQSYAK